LFEETKMESLEELVSTLLWYEKYWTRNSVKVELSPEEKKAIEKRTIPRVEVDVVAYNPIKDELLLVECKNYLDSEWLQVIYRQPLPKKCYPSLPT